MLGHWETNASKGYYLGCHYQIFPPFLCVCVEIVFKMSEKLESNIKTANDKIVFTLKIFPDMCTLCVLSATAPFLFLSSLRQVPLLSFPYRL